MWSIEINYTTEKMILLTELRHLSQDFEFWITISFFEIPMSSSSIAHYMYLMQSFIRWKKAFFFSFCSKTL